MTQHTTNETGERPVLAEFIIRKIEQAIHDAKHPKGMHTNGPCMAQIEVTHLERLFRAYRALPPTSSEPVQGVSDAEGWLRSKYGAYRGHFAWRELEEAFNAGRSAQGKGDRDAG